MDEATGEGQSDGGLTWAERIARDAEEWKRRRSRSDGRREIVVERRKAWRPETSPHARG